MTWFITFNLAVMVLLFLDLKVAHRKPHAVCMKEAIAWSCGWVALAVAFGIGVFILRGHQAGAEYFTAYVMEKALSVDNLFVMLMLFGFFQIKEKFRHKVLFYGILGAIVLRAGFILTGTALVQTFHWLLYFFGIFLVYAAFKMLRGSDDSFKAEDSPVVKLIQRYVPIRFTAESMNSGHFFCKDIGKTYATPLFLCLIAIELSDVMFAVDSIPVVLAVTQDPMVAYTSNIMAILGLRSLYFVVQAGIGSLRYLQPALGIVLGFIGVKMLVMDFIKVPTMVSLGVVVSILTVAVAASLIWKEEKENEPS